MNHVNLARLTKDAAWPCDGCLGLGAVRGQRAGGART